MFVNYWRLFRHNFFFKFLSRVSTVILCIKETYLHHFVFTIFLYYIFNDHYHGYVGSVIHNDDGIKKKFLLFQTHWKLSFVCVYSFMLFMFFDAVRHLHFRVQYFVGQIYFPSSSHLICRWRNIFLHFSVEKFNSKTNYI